MHHGGFYLVCCTIGWLYHWMSTAGQLSCSMMSFTRFFSCRSRIADANALSLPFTWRIILRLCGPSCATLGIGMPEIWDGALPFCRDAVESTLASQKPTLFALSTSPGGGDVQLLTTTDASGAPRCETSEQETYQSVSRTVLSLDQENNRRHSK
ncbi:uncharacterized protein P884DRAFT_113806 [Thermothelomyces heterothallicus CBS 202.75]|uniref:uncharacterized protein n=1 Tax=Thermothelomyces heterothallicus CBS 202.75 TaxID=1149848 RepID=UPI003743D63E